MSIPKVSAFDSVLERMYQRSGVDTLPAHLERTYGITASKVHQLDIGVFRVDQSGHGTPLVVRLFSVARPYAAAEADLAVLQYLAEKASRLNGLSATTRSVPTTDKRYWSLSSSKRSLKLSAPRDRLA